MQKIAQLMTLDPVTIEPDVGAVAALDLMIEHGIRHLPVVDKRDRLRGVVSLDDLRAAFPFAVSLTRPPSVSERDSARGCAVGEVMTHGPLTVRGDATLSEAAELLVRFRIECLPVVDGAGRVVGMFSETDALRALATPSARGCSPRSPSRSRWPRWPRAGSPRSSTRSTARDAAVSACAKSADVRYLSLVCARCRARRAACAAR